MRRKRKGIRWTLIFTLAFMFVGLGFLAYTYFNHEPDVPPIVIVPKEPIDHRDEGGFFELPVNGASGYASIPTTMFKEADEQSEILATMASGQVFTILREQGSWWRIEMDGMKGWIHHRFALINLPDVIPSIVYDLTNTYASELRSSGFDLPGITGYKLFDARAFNERFNEETFIVPVLYATAQKLQLAQNNALREGDTLVVHETFRPAFVQRKIVNALNLLSEQNEIVKQGISQAPWSMIWFIATSVSNHQRGYAVDMSLAQVISTQEKVSGEYRYLDVTKYEPYVMPSPFHELSIASVAFTEPVDSYSDSAWRMSIFASSMNQAARDLQTYATKAGLSPLASEWWHFNDLSQELDVRASGNTGQYQMRTVQSKVPRN